MLFRPEEIHGASGIGEVFIPFPHGNSYISHQSFRFNAEENAVFDIHPHGQPAIQTGGIDPDGLPGKKPAHGQRLKSSLAKPLLLTIDRQPILGRNIAKGGKGGDIVRPREKPGGNPDSIPVKVGTQEKKRSDSPDQVPQALLSQE